MGNTSRTETKPVAIAVLIRLTKRKIDFLNATIRTLESESLDYVEVGRRRRNTGQLIAPIQSKKERFEDLLKRFILSKARGTQMVDTPINLLMILDESSGGIT